MDMCAYETVALGHSAFCKLFTKREWKDYQYRNDIYWWYAASFGAPVAAAEGIGWLQELTARLTHQPLTQHNSSTNATLHNDIHFPVNQPLYVDFTHDTVFAQRKCCVLLLIKDIVANPSPADTQPHHILERRPPANRPQPQELALRVLEVLTIRHKHAGAGPVVQAAEAQARRVRGRGRQGPLRPHHPQRRAGAFDWYPRLRGGRRRPVRL